MRRLVTLLLVLICFTTAAHAAVPVPKHWHAPHQWLLGAICIHNHEGAWNDNTGNTYFGGLQFLPGTWKRAGGPDEVSFHYPGDQAGHPFEPTPREQLFYAYRLWLHDGRSWSEWGTRGVCGLR